MTFGGRYASMEFQLGKKFAGIYNCLSRWVLNFDDYTMNQGIRCRSAATAISLINSMFEFCAYDINATLIHCKAFSRHECILFRKKIAFMKLQCEKKLLDSVRRPRTNDCFFLSRCVLVSVNRACFLVGENTNNRMHFAVCEMHVFCVSLSLSLVHCAHAFVWLRRNNTANLIFITNETNLHSVFLFCLFVYFCNFASAIIHTRVELHTFCVYVLIFSSPICCMRTDGRIYRNPLAIVWFLLQK